MKLFILSLISAFILNTCNDTDYSEENNTETTAEKEFKLEAFPQKWELVEMTGQMTSEPSSKADDLQWQEFYLLKVDKTFLKHRETDGKVLESTGIFEIKENDLEVLLELKHDKITNIIGNCYGDSPTETLIFNKNKDQLSGTWLACDGPGLTYKRVK